MVSRSASPYLSAVGNVNTVPGLLLLSPLSFFSPHHFISLQCQHPDRKVFLSWQQMAKRESAWLEIMLTFIYVFKSFEFLFFFSAC